MGWTTSRRPLTHARSFPLVALLSHCIVLSPIDLGRQPPQLETRDGKDPGCGQAPGATAGSLALHTLRTTVAGEPCVRSVSWLAAGARFCGPCPFNISALSVDGAEVARHLGRFFSAPTRAASRVRHSARPSCCYRIPLRTLLLRSIFREESSQKVSSYPELDCLDLSWRGPRPHSS